MSQNDTNQQKNRDRVEAALDAYDHCWRNWLPSAQDECRDDMARALAAADRAHTQQTNIIASGPPREPTDEMINAIDATHRPGWDVTWKTVWHTMYDAWGPDAVATNKSEFPPWSREVWDLIISVVSTTIGPNLEQNKRIIAKMHAAQAPAVENGAKVMAAFSSPMAPEEHDIIAAQKIIASLRARVVDLELEVTSVKRIAYERQKALSRIRVALDNIHTSSPETSDAG